MFWFLWWRKFKCPHTQIGGTQADTHTWNMLFILVSEYLLLILHVSYIYQKFKIIRKSNSWLEILFWISIQLWNDTIWINYMMQIGLCNASHAASVPSIYLSKHFSLITPWKSIYILENNPVVTQNQCIEGPSPSLGWDNYEMVKIHWQNLKILLSGTTGLISTKLGTKHHSRTNEGQNMLF